jgi:uncharacterized protein (TIGR03437 family)
MRQTTVLAVTILLSCLGLAGVAKSETANDRYYVAGISPSVVAPGSTTTYQVSVTNDLKSGPSHFVRQVSVTVPAGFTLITSPGADSPVTPPSGWRLQSISGQVITVVASTNSTLMTPGKSVAIEITAQAPAVSGDATQSYAWLFYVNQEISGGVGNTYNLRAGTVTPTVIVATPDLVAPTRLVLNSIDPASLVTGNTGTTVTLTATLTSSTGVPILNEPVTFTIGGEPIACLNPATTNSNGTATCSYVPQASPNTPLIAGLYDIFANFAGDTTPTPQWGSSMSLAEQLTVSADGTALSLTDASGPWNGTVNLTATLTTGSNHLPLSAKTVTFYLNSVAVGSAQTNSVGVVSVSNVSLTGISAGYYPQYILASFAGDGTYAATSNSATLAVLKSEASISWNPADLVYGTPLGAAQLNATTSIPGIFVYTPAAGSVLDVGAQALSVTFTPTDQVNYKVVTTTVFINVLESTSSGPTIFVGGVVNAASFTNGQAVAPGSLVAIFGANLSTSTASATTFPLPTSLGNTSITLNGIPMPLLYVSATQVNAQVPFEISTGTMNIVATSNNLTSKPATVEISSTGPGIFLLGETHAAATNHVDGAVNSSLNPVKAGSYVTVYFTGQGAFDNPNVTGEAAPMSPLSWTVAETTASVGGINTFVSFSGATPTLAGLSQVNLVVPAGLAPGEYPVSITVGGVTSNSGTLSTQ